MSLLPELIDRVLGHLSDDSESLKALSLVSKDWTSWCQARLFKSIHLTPLTLEGWLRSVPKEVDEPASHTRTLILEEDRHNPWINPQSLDFPLSNLASFSNVTSLSLVRWNAAYFHGASLGPYFGHFGKTLGAVSLRICRLQPVTLFDLLSLLPNVDDLEIERLYTHAEVPDAISDIPEVTPNFCGTLSFADLGSGDPILKAIAALPLRFSTIRIKGRIFNGLDRYQLLLDSCRDTLIALHFEESYRGTLGVYSGLL